MPFLLLLPLVLLLLQWLPKSRRKIAGAFIAKEEGFRARPYPDGNGVSVGFGTNFPGKTAAQVAPVTEAQAWELLYREVDQLFARMDRAGLQLRPNAAAALCSLGYNCGPGAIDAMIPRIRAGWSFDQIAYYWRQWNKSGNPLRENPVLTARRARELALFKKDYR